MGETIKYDEGSKNKNKDWQKSAGAYGYDSMYGSPAEEVDVISPAKVGPGISIKETSIEKDLNEAMKIVNEKLNGKNFNQLDEKDIGNLTEEEKVKLVGAASHGGTIFSYKMKEKLGMEDRITEQERADYQEMLMYQALSDVNIEFTKFAEQLLSSMGRNLVPNPIDPRGPLVEKAIAKLFELGYDKDSLVFEDAQKELWKKFEKSGWKFSGVGTYTVTATKKIDGKVITNEYKAFIQYSRGTADFIKNSLGREFLKWYSGAETGIRFASAEVKIVKMKTTSKYYNENFNSIDDPLNDTYRTDMIDPLSDVLLIYSSKFNPEEFRLGKNWSKDLEYGSEPGKDYEIRWSKRKKMEWRKKHHTSFLQKLFDFFDDITHGE